MVCVCVFVRMYLVCAFTCMHVYLFRYDCTNVYAIMHTFMHAYRHTDIQTYSHKHTHIHINTHTHSHILSYNAHIHAHLHNTHIHIHTHTRTDRNGPTRSRYKQQNNQRTRASSATRILPHTTLICTCTKQDDASIQQRPSHRHARLRSNAQHTAFQARSCELFLAPIRHEPE